MCQNQVKSQEPPVAAHKIVRGLHKRQCAWAGGGDLFKVLLEAFQEVELGLDGVGYRAGMPLVLAGAVRFEAGREEGAEHRAVAVGRGQSSGRKRQPSSKLLYQLKRKSLI